jgi:hypothetical protein
VTCQFWVAFFGFDAGQTLTVSFTGQAPTGAGVPVTVTGATTTFVAPTAASGAGRDFDGDLGFTAGELGLSALGPPAQQGFHLRLTVTTGSGGGFKYKVFWLQPCAPATVPGATTIGGTSSGGATVLGEHFTRAPSKTTSTSVKSTTARAPRAHVLGVSFTRTGSLPFTGAKITAMVFAGLMLLVTGSGLTVATRRSRYVAVHAR